MVPKLDRAISAHPKAHFLIESTSQEEEIPKEQKAHFCEKCFEQKASKTFFCKPLTVPNSNSQSVERSKYANFEISSVNDADDSDSDSNTIESRENSFLTEESRSMENSLCLTEVKEIHSENYSCCLNRIKRNFEEDCGNASCCLHSFNGMHCEHSFCRSNFKECNPGQNYEG